MKTKIRSTKRNNEGASSTGRTVPSAPEHTEDELKANRCAGRQDWRAFNAEGKVNTMIYLKKIFILLFLFQSIDRHGVLDDIFYITVLKNNISHSWFFFSQTEMFKQKSRIFRAAVFHHRYYIILDWNSCRQLRKHHKFQIIPIKQNCWMHFDRTSALFPCVTEPRDHQCSRPDNETCSPHRDHQIGGLLDNKQYVIYKFSEISFNTSIFPKSCLILSVQCLTYKIAVQTISWICS